MNRVLIAAACVLLAAGGLVCQTLVKPATKPASVGKPEAVSNEDANIRAYIELLRTDVRKSRAQIVGQIMRLDRDPATKFWPIYREFETEYEKIGDQILAVVREYVDHYESMTDAVADRLGNQLLSIEQQRNALKKKFYDSMKEELGAITASRFLQVENQLERIVDLQIAAQLPVAGDR